MSEHDEMKALDRLLDQAAALPEPDPSEALMARILADAEAVQDGFAEPSVSAARDVRRSTLGALWQGLGGWPAFGSFATASLVGIWLGVAPPEVATGVSAAIWGDDEVAVTLYSEATLPGLGD